MIKVLSIILVLYSYSISNCYAQQDLSLIEESFLFLDKKFHWNINKADEPILIIFNDNFYLYNNNVFDNKKLDCSYNLDRISIIYELNSLGENTYSFELKWSSKIKGEIYVNRTNNTYDFQLIKYIKQSHY